jgi:hypothetical protein
MTPHLLNFDLNADPDPDQAFFSNADPNPASQITGIRIRNPVVLFQVLRIRMSTTDFYDKGSINFGQLS